MTSEHPTWTTELCSASSSGSDCAASTSSVSTCHRKSRAHQACSACNHQPPTSILTTNRHITHTERTVTTHMCSVSVRAAIYASSNTVVVVKYTQPTHTPFCRKSRTQRAGTSVLWGCHPKVPLWGCHPKVPQPQSTLVPAWPPPTPSLTLPLRHPQHPHKPYLVANMCPAHARSGVFLFSHIYMYQYMYVHTCSAYT
jgi:hypothetical protein